MIKVESVYKYYGDFIALNDVSLKVGKGLTLLLGPNGAGKTTLLKCMNGLINFVGRISIEDYDVLTEGEKARSILGYLPQKVSIYDNMECWEIVDFYSKLRKIDLDVREVLEIAELQNEVRTKFGELSGGMKQRFALALLISSDLPILVLDEPMSNLDPMGRKKFEEIFRNLKKEKTILVSSHSLGGLLPYADKVLVMNKGRVIYEGIVDDFLSLLEEKYKAYIRTSSGWETVISRSFNELMREINSKHAIDVIFEEIPIDQIISKIEV